VQALIVSFDVVPDRREQFLAAIAENATACRRDEPGCLHFDVAEDINRPNRFYFYELYCDAEALAAHRSAPHFLRWREAASQCVITGSQTRSVATVISDNF